MHMPEYCKTFLILAKFHGFLFKYISERILKGERFLYSHFHFSSEVAETIFKIII